MAGMLVKLYANASHLLQDSHSRQYTLVKNPKEAYNNKASTG